MTTLNNWFFFHLKVQHCGQVCLQLYQVVHAIMVLHHSNFLPCLWSCAFTASMPLQFVIQFSLSQILCHQISFLDGYCSWCYQAQFIPELFVYWKGDGRLESNDYFSCPHELVAQNLMTGLSYGLWLVQVSKVSTDKRSLKRSTTHVYISHLIRVLQIPESKDSLPLHLNQPRPQDILRQGAFMTMNDFNGNRNGLNGATSARAIINMVDKNSNQVEMGTLLQRTLQDQPQTSSASGVHNSQKQVNLAMSI